MHDDDQDVDQDFQKSARAAGRPGPSDTNRLEPGARVNPLDRDSENKIDLNGTTAPAEAPENAEWV
jgi:hypothetical protein